MHIGLHHDAVIPPARYGGTERIVYWLAKGLLELGHKVSLIARKGSAVKGAELIPVETWKASDPKAASQFKLDIVHYHAPPPTEGRSEPTYPYLVTIHGNGKPGEIFLPNSVFVSAKHAANHGTTYFVHNGIDPNDYRPASKREDYLVFLAKTTWKVKNFVGAEELAKAANTNLKVMGNKDIFLGLERLFPPIGGIEYLGMVNDYDKRLVLSRARALLFPVRWQEPFGIAVTEALASGCAVFGTPYGALPEIVTPEVGVLSTSAHELLRAIKNFPVHPERCRARVLDGLTHTHMAKKYVTYYEQVLANKHLLREVMGVKVPCTPKATFTLSPETLSPYEYLKKGRK